MERDIKIREICFLSMADRSLRQQIQDLQQDTRLTPQERSQRLFHIMNPDSIGDIQESTNTSTTTEEDSPDIICNHYQRHCSIVATCCQKEFGCRRCHDEQCDHEIDRRATQEIRCQKCQTRQPVSNKCVSCQQVFGDYYCEICRLWSCNPDIPMYHCAQCGICRQGKGLGIDFFHCDKCECCLTITSQDSHTCLEKKTHQPCPICRENLFHSTHPVSILPCGHSIHQKCLHQHSQHDYRCPWCKTSIGDMTGMWAQLDHLRQHIGPTMPSEYRHWKYRILCQDCHTYSIIQFDIQFRRCHACQGYNTNVIQTISPEDWKHRQLVWEEGWMGHDEE